jgi:signal transduction histidine kinase
MTPLTLKTRIFLSSALVAVLSVAFAVRFVSSRVAREAEGDLRRGLSEAGTLVEQNQALRVDTLRLMARLVADAPQLKAAVDTSDPTTVRPLAEDYKARLAEARLAADLFAVSDRSGRELVALGAPASTGPPSPAVRSALAGNESMTFRAAPAPALQVITVPIFIEFKAGPREVMGTLSIGFALDNALATQLAGVTQSHVALAVPGRVLASTLPREHDVELARRAGQPGISMVTLADNDYVVLERPLTGTGEAAVPVALILRSRTERLQFLRTFRAGLFVAALVAVVVAVLLSYWVAGTVTGPLSAITAAMREMTATGDLTRKIRLGQPWEDEDARVLAAAFNTLTDSIARFQREAALRERLSALGRLSTVIAHEVRNPLMIIKATLRALRRPGLSTRDLQEAAGDIDQEVTRLNRIVGDVLDFARPVTLACAPTDLNALCREAAAAAMTGDGAPAWRLSLDPRLAPVVTDGERLRTVVLNILSNAREAVQTGAGGSPAADAPNGASPDVELRTESLADGRAAIEVQDRGVGIEPADLPHVFEPYFTTKRTGTGLGLAIAKNIVDALGGTLTAARAEPAGARLRIELPPLPPPAPERAAVPTGRS